MADTSVRGKLLQVFQSFDHDGSGTVSTDELGLACAALGLTLSKADVAAMVKDADEDASGEVTFEEFAAAFKKLQQCSSMLFRMYYKTTNPRLLERIQEKEQLHLELHTLYSAVSHSREIMNLLAQEDI